ADSNLSSGEASLEVRLAVRRRTDALWRASLGRDHSRLARALQQRRIEQNAKETTSCKGKSDEQLRKKMLFGFCVFVPGNQHRITEEILAVFCLCNYFIAGNDQDGDKEIQDSGSDSAFTN